MLTPAGSKLQGCYLETRPHASSMRWYWLVDNKAVVYPHVRLELAFYDRRVTGQVNPLSALRKNQTPLPSDAMVWEPGYVSHMIFGRLGYKKGSPRRGQY